jgi:hypothetical protein
MELETMRTLSSYVTIGQVILGGYLIYLSANTNKMRVKSSIVSIDGDKTHWFYQFVGGIIIIILLSILSKHLVDNIAIEDSRILMSENRTKDIIDSLWKIEVEKQLADCGQAKESAKVFGKEWNSFNKTWINYSNKPNQTNLFITPEDEQTPHVSSYANFPNPIVRNFTSPNALGLLEFIIKTYVVEENQKITNVKAYFICIAKSGNSFYTFGTVYKPINQYEVFSKDKPIEDSRTILKLKEDFYIYYQVDFSNKNGIKQPSTPEIFKIKYNETNKQLERLDIMEYREIYDFIITQKKYKFINPNQKYPMDFNF